MVPHIQSLEHRAARQRTLHVEVPPLRIRIVLHRRQEADRLPKERVRAQRGSNRLRKSRREWIAETIRRGQVVVRRRHICRRRAESLLVRYCTRAICSRGGQRRERLWLNKYAKTGANHRLRIDGEGEAEPRAEEPVVCRIHLAVP